MSKKREDSPKTGLFLKKEVIKKIFDIYLETKKRISDEEISKMFLDATNGKTIKNVEDKLLVDDKGNYDLLQGLLNKEMDYQFKDLFKIRLSEFINKFIGIEGPQESIIQICKDVAEEYSNIRIKKVGKKEKQKEYEDAYNYCLINTNHMFTQEIKEYQTAMYEINKERIRNLQPKLNQKYYLPHWVLIAFKLPKSTLGWSRSMLGQADMSKQINSFLSKYNKKDGEIPGYYEFLNAKKPLEGGRRKKTRKRRRKIKKRKSKRKTK